jgi:hypothetical protein
MRNTTIQLGMCIAIAEDAFLAVTAEGKRGMVKLSQRMVGCFCASLTASATQRWTTLSGTTDVSVRVSSHYSADLGQHSGVVLGAAASIWLPVPCEHVFAFVRDESTRSQVHVHSSRRWPSSLFIYFLKKLVDVIPLADDVVLFAIAAAAVGRPGARQSGSGGVAHPRRHQSRQLHLLA